jgi:hypothetical protein
MRSGLRVIVAWSSLAVAAGCLTVMFLSMRSVMEIGGFCASGGPYVIENECPKGVSWMMTVAIFVGLLALLVHVVASMSLPGPRFALLAWPALFLSLGWNFWEFGLDAGAENGGGTAAGWIVCGVVFVLMGGLPLIWLLASPTGRRSLLWADGESSTDRPTVRATAASVSPLAVRKLRSESAMRPPPGPPRLSVEDDDVDPDDFTTRLERLAAMYRRGDLSAAEFEAAKSKLLTEGGGS